MDADLATDVLLVWGDYTGDMDRALDNVEDLKTLLLNFAGEADDLHSGISKLFDTIQLLIPRLADRAESFRDDAVEAQDTLTVFREEVETDYIERASLEPLYELVRDMRDGYHGDDMPGVIDKLYNQVTEMM